MSMSFHFKLETPVALLLLFTLFFIVLEWDKHNKLADLKEGTLHDLPSNDHSAFDINEGNEITNERIFNRVNKVRQFCIVNREELMKTYPNYDLHRETLLNQKVWIIPPHQRLFYCSVATYGSGESTTRKLPVLRDFGISRNHGDLQDPAADFPEKHSALETSNKNITEILDKFYPDNRLMVVRNPWQRLVSVYLHRFWRKKDDIKNLCYGWRSYQHLSHTDFTFAKFIDCLLQKPSDILYGTDTHPTLSLCAMCRLDYNIIIKFEELDKTTGYPMNQLELEVNARQLHDQQEPMRYRNSYSDYYLQVPPQQIHQLQKVYREDIELFDYPNTPFD